MHHAEHIVGPQGVLAMDQRRGVVATSPGHLFPPFPISAQPGRVPLLERGLVPFLSGTFKGSMPGGHSKGQD